MCYCGCEKARIIFSSDEDNIVLCGGCDGELGVYLREYAGEVIDALESAGQVCAENPRAVFQEVLPPAPEMRCPFCKVKIVFASSWDWFGFMGMEHFITQALF